MTNRNKTLIYIVAILSMILSFVLIILAKAIEMSATGSIDIVKILQSSITSVSFWLLNIFITVAIILFWFWSFTLRKEKLIQSDEFKNALNEYNNLLKFKRNDFLDFVKEENAKRRVNAYVNYIKKKIIRQEKKLAKVRPLGIKFGKDIRIQNKINLLKTRITKEYLDSHTVWRPYNVVSQTDFRTNAYGSQDISDRTSSIEGLKVTSTMAYKAIISLAVSAVSLTFITSLIIQFKFGTGFWITLISVIVTLSLQLYGGMRFADKIYESEYILLLENRSNFMKDYINYSKKNNTDDEESYADRVLNAYTKNEQLKTQLDDAIKKAESMKNS